MRYIYIQYILYLCHARLLRQILILPRPHQRYRLLSCSLLRYSATTLSFLFSLYSVIFHFSSRGSQYISSQWISAFPKNLWKTLDPETRSTSKPQLPFSALFHPYLSPRNTCSESPRQNDSLVVSVKQTSSSISINRAQTGKFCLFCLGVGITANLSKQLM